MIRLARRLVRGWRLEEEHDEPYEPLGPADRPEAFIPLTEAQARAHARHARRPTVYRDAWGQERLALPCGHSRPRGAWATGHGGHARLPDDDPYCHAGCAGTREELE